MGDVFVCGWSIVGFSVVDSVRFGGMFSFSSELERLRSTSLKVDLDSPSLSRCGYLATSLSEFFFLLSWCVLHAPLEPIKDHVLLFYTRHVRLATRWRCKVASRDEDSVLMTFSMAHALLMVRLTNVLCRHCFHIIVVGLLIDMCLS